MNSIYRCHHASDVHRLSQCHVGRGRPPFAINAQNIASGEHQRRVAQNLWVCMLASVALHVLIFNVLQTSGRSLVFTGRPCSKLCKASLAPAASTFSKKYACGTRGVRISSLDLGILQNLNLLTFALPL